MTLCVALIGAVGCTQSSVQVAPQQRDDLERRARDLLMRAAESDLDVLRCNAIEALVQIAPKDGARQFRVALTSDSAMVRFAGCCAVGEARDTEALDGIAKCLRDSEPRVRLAAAFASYRCGDGNQAKVLINTLTDSPDENLRCDAAYLIGRLGDNRAIKRLKLATNDKSNKVVVHVYTAMATLGDQEALERLIQYAQGDAVSRVIALQSLAELGKERAKDALLYRLSKAEDYLEARLIAARGLGRLKVKAGYDLAAKSTSYDATDPDETMRVRSLAALALGAIGDDRALPLLEKLAESQDDARVQVAASFAICQILRR